MQRWKKYSLLTVTTILGLMLLSMLIVPWQIKMQGSKWFAENTTRQLTIGKAFFNPFTLTIEVEGVKLSEQNSDKAFVSFRRLMLSGSVRSIIDLAVILDRVELDGPYLNIELLGKQEFNFSDFTRLGDAQPQPANKEPGRPLLFSVNNIILTGGAIDFTDQTSAKKSKHQITELDLAVPFIGNIPYLTDDYVEP
ncbi:MAG: AsmA family protein, partial [Geopsychrobacter sp.]|nr:AsmA family protein [Geopsychrobacter sp.]